MLAEGCEPKSIKLADIYQLLGLNEPNSINWQFTVIISLASSVDVCTMYCMWFWFFGRYDNDLRHTQPEHYTIKMKKYCYGTIHKTQWMLQWISWLPIKLRLELQDHFRQQLWAMASLVYEECCWQVREKKKRQLLELLQIKCFRGWHLWIEWRALLEPSFYKHFILCSTWLWLTNTNTDALQLTPALTNVILMCITWPQLLQIHRFSWVGLFQL